ncbi:uncharacterized protein DEA37_0000788 [Paragonimus westermani]|uniref:Reverse transcriptase domain-containing protein n=1 Tax=Paragonimus westermani TaxID=34504 RepID=A0A5J4NUY7_9TREM|nr:uncharacterized protein DEA37_0000788 [Paragonimus westermani]
MEVGIVNIIKMFSVKNSRRKRNIQDWVSKKFLQTCYYDKDHPEYKYCPIFKFSTIFEEANVSESIFVTPTTTDNLGWLKTKLTDIANGFIMTPINGRCAITKQHLQSLKELKSKNLVILKPDKGSGTVILDRDAYVQKMLSILEDRTKFQQIDTVDNVNEIEGRIARHLELLLQLRLIDDRTYKALKPCGSSTPQLYGLPKTHKSGMPLRPILAMTNSPYHKLARWLVEILTPLKQKFQTHSIKDSFELISDLENINLANELMCSIDVQSLFTNVPLHETIDFIGELVEMSHITLPLPNDILREALLLCTENISFRFLDRCYRQIDGVAMGSPLGPILADFFMLKIERELATDIAGLSYYKRYVDDTLAFSRSKQAIDNLVQRLNSCHPNLKVTCEFGTDNCLPFLDILISRREDGSIKRAVYRKSTWSGQYLNFSSFTPVHHKRALVNTLFTQARRICTQDSLARELNLITSTLQSSDQPVDASSHCVYQFTCNCKESYIGRTESCLIPGVKEHLPKWVQRSVLQKNGNVIETHKPPAFAVVGHILTTCHVIDPICAFRILIRHSNPKFLRFAEAVAIDRLKPALCVQK